MMPTTGTVLESVKDFKGPEGKYEYWLTEIQAAQSRLKKWHKTGDKIVDRFIGKRSDKTGPQTQMFDLNLFHSNISTLNAMLYGDLPAIDVSRRHADANDDVGRVAAATMERLLNLDVAENGKEIDAVFRSALSDRLLPGLGCARVRYEFTKQMNPETQMEEVTSESSPIDYYYWGDVLWGWCRNFAQMPWISYRSYLNKDEATTRFGEKIANLLEYKKQQVATSDESDRDVELDGAWLKAEIWEIWDKKSRKVIWLSVGYTKVLDTKDDTLKLKGFFPSPPFFIANPTTSLYMPTPDFTLAQDLYNEIDKLQERISMITEAVKVVGVYDGGAKEVGQMFRTGMDNDLIPVDNWALFGEKGGLRGVIDWLPIEDIVKALDKLRDLRNDAVGLLQQITGMSDVMRGELSSPYEGVGQSQLKAKFGSIRIQQLQDQFATFASDLMQLKAEVIAKHYEPKTIAEQSNMQFSMDVELLPQAIELIKSPKARLRVKIRAESIAMVDYAQLKAERTEYLTAISTFMQSAAPLIQSDPGAKPFLLQLLQWGLAGFKGASEIEGVLDKAIEQSQQEANNPQPDPAAQKAQQDAQREQAKQQAEMQKIQAKAQADMQVRQQDMQADIQTAMAIHEGKMREVEAGIRADVAKIRAKLEADVLVEQVQAQTNIEQTIAAARAETEKDMIAADLDIEKEVAKTNLKIGEMEASTISTIAAQTPKEDKDDA